MKSISKIAALATCVLVALAALATAKELPPPPEKMKKLSFPDFKEFSLKSGLQVVVVEHNEQPVASIWLAVRAGTVLDPEGKSGVATMTGILLNKGTADKSAEELADWIESAGGDFAANVQEDYTVLTLSLLSEHLDTAYEFLSHILTNATFPDEEMSKERKRLITGLEFELSDPTAMADRHFTEVVYGHHPYAVHSTVETVEAVTRDDVAAFHAKNFVANNAIMFVVGDVSSKQVKKDVKKHFGEWESGEPDVAEYPEPPSRTAKNISLYHRPGSVQTNLYVGHLGLRPSDPDWPAVAVANKILGGGATGRLFMTLREDKGWTYGAYSQFSKSADVGFFRATANVRTEVTDSALTEMVAQIEKMVDEPVTDKELEDAQSYLVGNFPTTIETPNQIASQIGQIKLLGLDKSYLEAYRKKVATVTQDDVTRVMKTHVQPDRLAIIAVGDAAEVKEKIEPIASVALYDIEGTPMSMDELAVQGIEFDFDTSSLTNHSATYNVRVQDAMDLGDLNVTLTRKSDDTFVATSKLAGLLTLEETLEFAAADFSPQAYDFVMAAPGQEMKANYSFADGGASGRIEGGQDGPKDVSVKLVDGTILTSSIEFLIATLPLGETKSYKFPSLDAQSGVLQNVRIEVEGEEDLMVPAGSFSTYKVRVKEADGEVVFYVQKDAPHWVVKQEVPAQALSITLKSVDDK